MSVPVAYRWLAAMGLAGAIVVLSVTPGEASEGDSAFVWLVVVTPTLLQKSMHVLIYGALAAAWYWALENNPWPGHRIPIVAAGSLVLGAGLEWYQTFVPGRFGSLADVLLDGIGIAVGLALVGVLGRAGSAAEPPR